MLAPAPSTPTGTAVIGRRLRSLASRLRDTVLGGGRSDSRSRSLGTAAGSAGGSAASLAHEAAAQHGAGGRRLLQDLLTSDSGVADPMLFEYMNTNQLLGDQVEVDPLSFGAPSIFSGASFRSAQTVVGGELPEPAVDPSLLPPLTDVLSPVFNQTDLWDDYFISWLPANETEGVCLMTNSADLPEAFLLGDFEELVGYEEDCSLESLPEVGSGEMDPLLTAGLGQGAAGGAALPPTDSTGLIG